MMSVENLLLFFFKYNAVLIEALVASILLVTAYLALRLFKNSQDEELHPASASAAPDMAKLEEMLKTILEKASQVPAAAAHAPSEEGTGPNPEVASLVEQINTLKIELEKKQVDMGGAGATAAPAAGGMSSEERQALESKLGELKKKLEEYDIIAQDIADLSFFKEENQRLQQELANLKGGAGAKAQDPIPPTPEAPAVAPEVQVTESAPSASPEVAVAPPAPATAAAEPAPTPASTPVPRTIAVEAPAPAAAPSAISVAPPMPAASTAAEVEASPTEAAAAPVAAEPPSEETTSMLADWEAAVAEQAPTAHKPAAPAAEAAPTEEPPALDLGTMDLDKMTEEAGALMEAPAVAVEDALSQEMDPDKLAAEAAGMEVPAETKTELTEFENFINKGS